MLAVWLQRRDLLEQRQKTQPQAAALARGVLEVERVPAILAFEQLHDAPGSAGVTRPESTRTVGRQR
jgi:hypothetical protein